MDELAKVHPNCEPVNLLFLVFTYHSLLSESADLPDSPGGPLLEADTVDLYPQCISLVCFFSLPPDACIAKDECLSQCNRQLA